MNTASVTFVSIAEAATLASYQFPRKYSVAASEILSRIAAGILLTPAAALDIGFHSCCMMPACIYACGQSIYKREMDFTLPWQHLQRIRNAVAPLLLGSAFGILSPYAGLTVSEPTDKHAVLGMLSSNTQMSFETPCSPIHSLSIIENIAAKQRYSDDGGLRREIFSPEYVKIVRGIKKIEKSLEVLQAQEYLYKITNLTLLVMATILQTLEMTDLRPINRELLIRFSGVLIPVLATVDLAIALLAETFFLTSGILRVISGRGPIYTEVSANPLMHVSFLIQIALKTLGIVVGTAVWIGSPRLGFKVSLIPGHLFFKTQLNLLMLQIKFKMFFSKENERFVIPILYGDGMCSPLSVPTHSSHKTYLIVENKGGNFDLTWVNRPTVTQKTLSFAESYAQIRSMLDVRFPYMDMDKVLNYPVKASPPVFDNASALDPIAPQGNETNCVVSNLFGMFEQLDRKANDSGSITLSRNKAVRSALMKDYSFYQGNFSPFYSYKEDFFYSMQPAWETIQATSPITDI